MNVKAALAAAAGLPALATVVHGVRRVARRTGLYGFAGALVLTGLGFMITAAYIMLAARFGAAPAAAMVGAALVVVGLGLAGLLAASVRPPSTGPARSISLLAQEARLMSEGVNEVAAGRPMPLSVVALSLGVLVSARARGVNPRR